MDTTNQQQDEAELKKLKRKLYHKEYYAKNKSVWNKYKEEKQQEVEEDNTTLSYYERNKEQKKEYQRKRYEEKKKGIIKQKSPEDQLIETLYKIYQDSKKEKII